MFQGFTTIGDIVFFILLAIQLAATCSVIPKRTESISELGKAYKNFIVDQWGVLHDGKVAYPGSIDALEALKIAGTHVIMLSNSSKRKKSSFRGLNRIGFRSELFLDVVTSGEVAYERIRDRMYDFLGNEEKEIGCFVIGNGEDDADYLQDCGCNFATLEKASFVLARGMFSFNDGMEEKRFTSAQDLLEEVSSVLVRCRSLDLPMLVTNPDLYRPGSNAPMPGQIGSRYSEIGGKVLYVGKPYADVYKKCFDSFQSLENSTYTFSLKDTCGVGDSLHHDILGAKLNGVASVFISNGVHSQELGVVEGEDKHPGESALRALFLTHPECGVPDYILSNFR